MVPVSLATIGGTYADPYHLNGPRPAAPQNLAFENVTREELVRAGYERTAIASVGCDREGTEECIRRFQHLGGIPMQECLVCDLVRNATHHASVTQCHFCPIHAPDNVLMPATFFVAVMSIAFEYGYFSFARGVPQPFLAPSLPPHTLLPNGMALINGQPLPVGEPLTRGYSFIMADRVLPDIPNHPDEKTEVR